MVGSNYSDELRVAGLTTPGKLLRQWDYTFGIGGPIKKDRLWYYVTARDEGQYRSIPNIFPNLNAGDPTKTLYAPDRTREVQGAESWRLYVVRLTYQASTRNKFNIHWDEQHPCNGSTFASSGDGCRNQPESGAVYGPLGLGGLSSTTSPEIGGYLYDHPRVRLIDLVLAGDEPPAVRGRVRRLPGALRSIREPGQPHARSRAGDRAVCSRVLAQRRHPEPDLSLGELGAELGRPVHLERLDVVRDRRPQPEDRVWRRGARLGSRESHQRSQPRLHRQQRHADLAHAEPVAVHHELSDPQHGVLRSGPVEARTHDASGRLALRSQLELLARTAASRPRTSSPRRSRFRKRPA